METSTLLQKVRAIEIKTRGLSAHIFSGEYHSAFKGRGMAFSEVREYTPGDDIRSIDWNVTARFGHPYVKVFEEERELTVILLVDVSASGDFGTKQQFKRQLMTELCAVLAFSAIQNNDKTGVIFFSDRIEKFIPPKKGKTHILRIIRELIEFKPVNRKTDLPVALQYLTNAIKKRSICFLISDFYAENFERELKLANKKHDLVALEIIDPREESLPDIGLVRFEDAETGTSQWIDTGDPAVREAFQKNMQVRSRRNADLFARSGVDTVRLSTDRSYVQPLMQLFKKRGSK
ncbi:MAG: DUF58 domain-containing protein [Bacteroidia bacterium]|nr:DUF58 domain-containing protein [Bacteroidia bacterium]MBP7269629.1 DUF58 domain-containing protein [Bacteroidia bacterium]MBP7436612.1 DUF58 domain-containing protein [Bacteroidia bacterium]MBP7772681.1 DUF58 domain-containing protein [Bacteroidia bacterium]